MSGHAKMPPASHQVSATSLKLLIQQIHPHVRVERDSGMCVARDLYGLWGRSPYTRMLVARTSHLFRNPPYPFCGLSDTVNVCFFATPNGEATSSTKQGTSGALRPRQNPAEARKQSQRGCFRRGCVDEAQCGRSALSLPRRLPSCALSSSSSNKNAKQRRPCYS